MNQGILRYALTFLDAQAYSQLRAKRSELDIRLQGAQIIGAGHTRLLP
jgi:hypothetical protein